MSQAGFRVAGSYLSVLEREQGNLQACVDNFYGRDEYQNGDFGAKTKMLNDAYAEACAGFNTCLKRPDMKPR